MNQPIEKQKRTKRIARLASGTALLGAIVGVGGLSAQATAGNYSVMGTGVEVREALSSMNSLQKPAELACGAKETKTTKESKASEAKCGEGKCGEMKQAPAKKNAAKEAKAMEKSTVKKAQSKVSEMKCGEGKCGGSMKKADSSKTAKAVQKAAAKQTKSKTTEAK